MKTPHQAPSSAKDEADFLNSVRHLMLAGLHETGHEALDGILQYPLASPGQGFRPLLVLRTARAVMVSLEASEPVVGNWVAWGSESESMPLNPCLSAYAAAVEFLHNASLLHDDLLDGSEIRRGQPALHRIHGDKQAILSGNIYYIQAFRMAMKETDAEVFAAMLEAAEDMCVGEMLQQQWLGRFMPVTAYLEVIGRKTASLIRMTCRESARLAGAGRELSAKAAELGTALGMIYQLRDDEADEDAGVGPSFSYSEQISLYREKAREVLAQMPVPSAWSSFSAWF
jgi:geranylgeranyl pyrophosphate synthase